jgi:glycosyltransferase involved in cell wall biosynthesis
MVRPSPFEFWTAGYLIRIANRKAGSIEELASGVAECTDASIFHHTFHTLGQHHFLTEGFSNDFAQWALASATRVELVDGRPPGRDAPDGARAAVCESLGRASTVIVRKSVREGFGLTVAEALWKKRPVVASAVGGIPLQVIHKHTGLPAHSVEGTSHQFRFLLAHPKLAAKLGEQGHQHVRESFL